MSTTIRFGNVATPINIPPEVEINLAASLRSVATLFSVTPIPVLIEPVVISRDGEETVIGECDCSEPHQIVAILRRYADRLDSEKAEVAS